MTPSTFISLDQYFPLKQPSEAAQSKSLKRVEENYKFIFKRCLKHMKAAFKRMLPKRRIKKQYFDAMFYEHYFKIVVEKEQVPLEIFYHPRNSSSKSEFLPRSINNVYVDNISKSQAFMADFTGYLVGGLEIEYKAVIESKIGGLVERWEDQLRDSSQAERAVAEICDYIERNKKCKLPWIMSEVTEAVASVKKLLSLP